MKVIRGFQNWSEAVKNPVVTIGNFDGVHLGHQSIFARVREVAKTHRGASVVYTFRPHPQVALNPEKNLPLLCTYDEKIEQIGKMGIDCLIEEPFSREFSTTSPDVFFKNAIIDRIRPVALIVGYDFGFGKGRSGGLDVLRELCEKNGIGFEVMPAFQVNGQPISSSRIRAHLQKAELKPAAELLGRNFSYHGLVLRGDGRGRKIGVPTANLHLDNQMTLPLGVYATWAHFSGQRFAAVTNIGIRPTFQPTDSDANAIKVETHVLDYAGDLYGRAFQVEFVEYLRPEQRFSGIQALTEQISRDILKVRTILEKN